MIEGLPPLSKEELKRLEDLIRKATPEQLDALDTAALYKYLTGREYHPLWNPLPGQQTKACDSLADEVFYGGAAGGGKSFLLLGLAVTKHKRSLVLRRVARYLKGLVDDLRTIAVPPGVWRSSGHGGTLHSLPNGAEIELGGCEQEDDKENYRGQPHDLISFDEATHFSKTQVQLIIGWNRSVDPYQRCRVVYAGNPPTTQEGQWIIEAFAPWLDRDFPNQSYWHPPDTIPTVALPGELRYYTTLEEKTVWVPSGESFVYNGELIKPLSRTFIPSLLTDNPILSKTGYRSKIQGMPEPLRSQLLYGDMSLHQEDNAYQIIPTEWVHLAQARWKPVGNLGIIMSALGADIARGGSNKTVIAKRYNNWIGPLVKIPGKETPDGPKAGKFIQKEHDGQSRINIDIIGVGGSVYDWLRGNVDKKLVHGISNNKKTDWKDRSTKQLTFVNVRAASYWNLRELLDPSQPDPIALPPDKELTVDLCTPQYEPLSSGIKVEKKEDIIDRTGRSPDCGDAVVLACWEEKKKEFWIR